MRHVVPSRSAALLVVSVLVTACAPLRQGLLRERSCPVPAAGAVPFTADSAARLAGTWEVTTVTTTPGLDRDVRTFYLELAPTDSAERYYRPTGFPNAPRRAQPLTGRSAYENAGRRIAVTWRLRGAYLVPDRGEGPCFDCGGLSYEIQHVADSAFWGRYRVSGGGYVLRWDADGRLIDGHEGVLCARRAPPRERLAP